MFSKFNGYLSLILLLFLCSNAWAWDTQQSAQDVDLVPLDRGFYTSSATITGSVSSIPLFGNFVDRRSMTITNSDNFSSVYITDTPFKNSVDAGYEILANTSFSFDIGGNITNSTVFISTSESTIEVSVSTIEIR